MTWRPFLVFGARLSWRVLLMTWLVLGGFDAAKGEPAGIVAVVVIVAGLLLVALTGDLVRLIVSAYREHVADHEEQQEPAA